MSDLRWRLGYKRGDTLRRLLCALGGHDWQTNPRGTQRVCYHCWTVWEVSE